MVLCSLVLENMKALASVFSTGMNRDVCWRFEMIMGCRSSQFQLLLWCFSI